MCVLGADLQLQLVPRPAEVPATRSLPTSALANASVAGRASAAPGPMPGSVLLLFYYYFLFLCVGFFVGVFLLLLLLLFGLVRVLLS